MADPIEAAAAELINTWDMLPIGDPFGRANLEAGRNALHSGDCTHENWSCVRCLFEQAIERSVAVVAAADAARLKDAPEVVHMLEEAASSEAMDAYGRDEVSRRLVREAATLITAQAARIEALEGSLKELLEANEADCGTPEICYEDDETVGASRREDGTIEPMAMTFGMLRRARATLEGK